MHPAFPAQELPGPAFEAGTLRLAGGTAALTEALFRKLPAQSVHLRSPIQKVTLQEHGAWKVIGANNRQCQADHVIFAAPPKNILQGMEILPAPSSEWLTQAQAIPTWMGHVGKCLCWFDRPFWRDRGLSGSGFMIGTPVGEFHDVSPSEASSLNAKNHKATQAPAKHPTQAPTKHPTQALGILVGFLNQNMVDHQDQSVRQAQVMQQFEQIFPGSIKSLQHYEDYLWFADPLSTSPPPSDHPAPEDPSRDMLFAGNHNKLIWASSETSSAYPGYLEGAVTAAERAVQQVLMQRS